MLGWTIRLAGFPRGSHFVSKMTPSCILSSKWDLIDKNTLTLLIKWLLSYCFHNILSQLLTLTNTQSVNMGWPENSCLFNILIIMTSYSNYFQPQGPGKYIFGIGCELHGEFVNTEEVTNSLLFHLLIPQCSLEMKPCTLLHKAEARRPKRKSYIIKILSILLRNIYKGHSENMD